MQLTVAFTVTFEGILNKPKYSNILRLGNTLKAACIRTLFLYKKLGARAFFI